MATSCGSLTWIRCGQSITVVVLLYFATVVSLSQPVYGAADGPEVPSTEWKRSAQGSRARYQGRRLLVAPSSLPAPASLQAPLSQTAPSPSTSKGPASAKASASSPSQISSTRPGTPSAGPPAVKSVGAAPDMSGAIGRLEATYVGPEPNNGSFRFHVSGSLQPSDGYEATMRLNQFNETSLTRASNAYFPGSNDSVVQFNTSSQHGYYYFTFAPPLGQAQLPIYESRPLKWDANGITNATDRPRTQITQVQSSTPDVLYLNVTPVPATAKMYDMSGVLQRSFSFGGGNQNSGAVPSLDMSGIGMGQYQIEIYDSDSLLVGEHNITLPVLTLTPAPVATFGTNDPKLPQGTPAAAPLAAAAASLTPAPTGSSSSSAPIAGIVGGVIGGLAFIGLTAAIVIFFIWRAKKQKSPEPPYEEQNGHGGGVTGAMTAGTVGLIGTPRRNDIEPILTEEGSGNYTDKDILPSKFFGLANGASNAIAAFCRKLITELEKEDESTVDHLRHLQPHANFPNDFSIHYALEGKVAEVLFYDFESPNWDTARSAVFPARGDPKVRVRMRKEYDAMRDGAMPAAFAPYEAHRLELLCEDLAKPEILDLPIDAIQRHCVEAGDRSSFSAVARSVFLLHRAAHTYTTPAEIISAKKGEPVTVGENAQYDVRNSRDVEPTDAVVDFTVMPGFRVGGEDSIYKCAVYARAAK